MKSSTRWQHTSPSRYIYCERFVSPHTGLDRQSPGGPAAYAAGYRSAALRPGGAVGLRPLFIAAFVTVLCLVFAVGGCSPTAEGPADSFGLDFSLPCDARKSGAMIFLVDGMNAAVFRQMLEDGELPAFKKYFVDRGLYVRQAVASTPSITLPNLTSVVTGVFPGHHGIIGNNWFDRNQIIWRNYETIAQKNMVDNEYHSPTIYEQFPDDLTFSIFYQPHRGATKFYENAISAAPVFMLRGYSFIDRLTLSRLSQEMDIARKYGRFPAITMVYQLSVDFAAYEHGVASAGYRAALKNVDRQIGRVLGDVERAGLLEHVYLALVSDHGHSQVEQHFMIKDFMRNDLGLTLCNRRWNENEPFEGRLEDANEMTAVWYGSGDKYAAICLRKPLREGGKFAGYAPWPDRPSAEDLHAYPTARGTLDLPAKLLACEAIEAVAYRRGPQSVELCNANGCAQLTQAGPGAPIFYNVTAGKDPLNWEAKLPPAVREGKEGMSPRQWLDATIGSRYPDAPAQILAYFRSARCGDLAIFSRPTWDFNNVNHSGHGGITPEDMFTPMIVAGPGIEKRTIDHARTVDLMPTILTLLGRPLPPYQDGQPLIQPPTRKP